jgi:hypothetical protein
VPGTSALAAAAIYAGATHVAIAVVVVVWVCATVLYMRKRDSRLMIAAEQAYGESARFESERRTHPFH